MPSLSDFCSSPRTPSVVAVFTALIAIALILASLIGLSWSDWNGPVSVLNNKGDIIVRPVLFSVGLKRWRRVLQDNNLVSEGNLSSIDDQYHIMLAWDSAAPGCRQQQITVGEETLIIMAFGAILLIFSTVCNIFAVFNVKPGIMLTISLCNSILTLFLWIAGLANYGARRCTAPYMDFLEDSYNYGSYGWTFIVCGCSLVPIVVTIVLYSVAAYRWIEHKRRALTSAGSGPVSIVTVLTTSVSKTQSDHVPLSYDDEETFRDDYGDSYNEGIELESRERVIQVPAVLGGGTVAGSQNPLAINLDNDTQK